MGTTIATALAAGTASDAASQLIRELRSQLGGAHPALTLVFASTKQPLEAIMPLVQNELGGITLGASTAGEFTEKGDASGSVSAFAVAGDFRVFAGLGRKLKADVEGAVRNAVKDLPTTVEGFPHRTAILLLDPLAGNGEEATLITADLLGGDVRLAGGAAGDDLKMSATNVGLGAQAASDAVVVAVIFSKEPLGVGVCHGHEALSKPLKVTRAEGGVVSQIDGRPAWDVWMEETRGAAAKLGVDPAKLKPEEIGQYLLRYEAGLSTGGEYKIRAPLARQDDGSLAFACGIPEGSVIRITESEPKRQVDSARTAARRARDQVGGAQVAGALVFDCICRKLILDKAFETALNGISQELGGVKLAGFETYGEIALDAGDMSGFHNTTTVVLTFPR